MIIYLVRDNDTNDILEAFVNKEHAEKYFQEAENAYGKNSVWLCELYASETEVDFDLM